MVWRDVECNEGFADHSRSGQEVRVIYSGRYMLTIYFEMNEMKRLLILSLRENGLRFRI